ncbi:MAG: ABC transporter permease [Candidatus Diapherotrites archaeon]
MMDLETFTVALRNLRHQRLRSFLTLAGVIIGVAAIVALISVGEGLQNAVLNEFESIGLNTIAVEPGSGDFLETALSRTLSENDVEIMKRIDGVEVVIPFYYSNANAFYRKESSGVMIIGFDPEYTEHLERMGYMKLLEGRMLDPNDRYSFVIGENFAKNEFSNELGVKSRLEMGGKQFRIVGLLDEGGIMMGGSFGGMAWMHKDIVKSVFGVEDPMEIVVIAKSQDDVKKVVAEIEYELEKDHGSKDFYVMSMEQMLEGADMILGLIQLVLVGIAAISLAVGGIGIMNTMFMAVIERTREIGVMKAIGATNKKIRNMFILEAGFIGMVGGIIGALFGFGLALLIGFGSSVAGFSLPVDVSPVLFIEALIFAMIVGMISGYIPAKRASELDPVEALHYE